MRITVDIDDLILKDLRRLQKHEGKAFSRLVSELLAQALGQRRAQAPRVPEFRWVSRPMGARLDLNDRAAILAVEVRKPPRDRQP